MDGFSQKKEKQKKKSRSAELQKSRGKKKTTRSLSSGGRRKYKRLGVGNEAIRIVLTAPVSHSSLSRSKIRKEGKKKEKRTRRDLIIGSNALYIR